MTYSIYTTDSFEKETEKLSPSDNEIIKNIFQQLKQNPYVGDQIRYRFFREKRIKEKRIYFLIYNDLSAVLVVALSRKKAQKETIGEIVKLLPEFKKYMENLLKNSI